MRVVININKSTNKIQVYTDDLSIKSLFETQKTEMSFWGGTRRFVKVTKKMYDGKPEKIGDYYVLSFGLGWAAFIAGVLKQYVSPTCYETLVSSCRASSFPIHPFRNLRDYQNEDILHLLKYKVGLLNVYTGYGKTQLIATLLNYAYEMGKKVLLVAPGKKAKDELVKRVKSVFGHDIPSKSGNLDILITSGLLLRKDLKDPTKLAEFEARLKSYDWVLVDEVEYTINPGGEFIFSRCTGADHFYGFSGTADKYGGKMITFAQGLSDTVVNNKDLIKYFGPSLVYRLPLHLEIDDIKVSTTSLNNLNLTEEDLQQDANIYLTVMNKVWTNPDVCKVIMKIAKRYPMLFIPINNLNGIINEWIDKYWLGEFRILLISGEGYVYYDLDGTKTILNLDQACEYIKNKKVDIIPSTSSGYRALDFPGLEHILLIQGKVAGVTLQSIGRVARSKHMNIISLIPRIPTHIPIYTRGMKEREEMIDEFYKYCKIKKSIIREEDL